MSFTYLTVTIGSGLRDPGGTQMPAKVRFTPTAPEGMRNGTTTVGQVECTVAANGTLSPTVAATDDPGTLPVGGAYLIEVIPRGAPPRSFYAALPYDSPGGTVDLGSLAELGEAPTLSAGEETTAGSAAKIAVHSADTTSVHGIADTAALETTTGSTAKVTAHTGATDPHGDRAYAAGLFGASAGTATSDDTARIQALLTAARAAGGGTVRGVPGQNYQLSARLVIGSGTTLDMTGCTVTLKSGNQTNMLANYSWVNPAATASDGAVSSGSAVVTTALAASASVGQTVWVGGAGGSGNGPLIGNIASKTSTTVTLTKLSGGAATASATVSGATVKLFTRDTDIAIVGGRWDRGANGPDSGVAPGSAVAGHSLFLSHIDGLTVDLERVDSTHGITFVWITDVSRWSASVRSGSTVRTILQCVGPLLNGRIPHLQGGCTDDLLNICGNVYVNQTDSCGDVKNVAVGTIVAESVGGSAFKLNAGVGCALDDIVCQSVMGTAAIGVFLGEDTAQASTTGGSYGSIDLGYLGLTPTSKLLYLAAPTARLVRARGHVSTSTAVHVGGAHANVVGLLDLDLDIEGSVTDPVRVNGAAVVNRLVLRGRYANAASGGAAILRVHEQAQVKQVLFDRVEAVFTGSSNYLFQMNENGGAVVDEVVMRDCAVTFSVNTGSNYIALVDGANTCSRIKIAGGTMTLGAAAIRVESTITTDLVSVDRLTTNGADRLLNLRRAVTVQLGSVYCLTNGSAAIFVGSTATYNMHGGNVVSSGGTTTFLQRSGSEVVNLRAPSQRVDISLLARHAEGAAYNTNAALSCGVGPVVCDGTTWKNLSSGATY